MKKTLALILAVLVAFSMFTFATSAADLVNVKFMNDGAIYHEVEVPEGESLTPYVPAAPTKAPVVDENGEVVTEYIFKGWASSEAENATLYFKNTIPAAADGAVYYAVYSANEVEKTQTFWEFIESIFARINLIFEYFARIFDFS